MSPLCGPLPSMGTGQAGWAGEGRPNPVCEFFLCETLSYPLSPRSIESPSLGFCTDALLPHLLEDDLGQLSDLEPEPDAQNWQHTVGKDVVAGLSQREIDRQEVINGENGPHLPSALRHRWKQAPRTCSANASKDRVGPEGRARSV